MNDLSADLIKLIQIKRSQLYILFFHGIGVVFIEPLNSTVSVKDYNVFLCEEKVGYEGTFYIKFDITSQYFGASIGGINIDLFRITQVDIINLVP